MAQTIPLPVLGLWRRALIERNRTGAVADSFTALRPCGSSALRLYGPAHMAEKGGVQFGNRR